jgi:hypothetical protein
MVTDSNLVLWNSYFAKPPEEVPIDPETKKFVESLLIFGTDRKSVVSFSFPPPSRK